ncbi:amidase family protein [Mesorhizobium sp. M1312]|uniref:amidase family protein n=1 Tax=unclassified Mesorhizobium TaxID=325217 RepID=UPI00333C2CD2
MDGRRLCLPFNISGQPAISLPLGWSATGVPIGVQLVGRYGDEATVLAVSTQLEREMPWKDRRPKVSVRDQSWATAFGLRCPSSACRHLLPV